jgi:hypothetical protein
MEGHNGIAPVIGPAQDERQFGALHIIAHLGHLGRRLVQRLFALLLLSNVEKEPRFFEAGALFLPSLDDTVQRGLFP